MLVVVSALERDVCVYVGVGVDVGAGVGVDVDVGVDDLDNVAVFCLSSPPPIHFLSLFIKESLRYTC